MLGFSGKPQQVKLATVSLINLMVFLLLSTFQINIILLFRLFFIVAAVDTYIHIIVITNCFGVFVYYRMINIFYSRKS